MNERWLQTKQGGRGERRGRGHNVLVVVLDGVTAPQVHGTDVRVVVPALNSRLRQWLSDEDAARRQAAWRVAVLLEHLERRGVQAEGLVGDADPALAVMDALRTFAADEVVLASTDASSRRLDQLVARLCDRFDLRLAADESLAQVA